MQGLINAGTFKPVAGLSPGLPGLGERPLVMRHASHDRLDAALARQRLAAELKGGSMLGDAGIDREDFLESGEYRHLRKHFPFRRNIAFATGTISTSSGSFPPMSSLLANTGGAVETLADGRQGGKRKLYGGLLVLASQASTSILGLARLPLFGWLCGITLLTDTSLGSTTVAVGDAANTTLYKSAAVFTATNTPTAYGVTAQFMTQLVQGYDGLTGDGTNYNSSQTDAQTASPQSEGFGGLYEDVIVSLAAATAPSSGNFVIMLDYAEAGN